MPLVLPHVHRLLQILLIGNPRVCPVVWLFVFHETVNILHYIAGTCIVAPHARAPNGHRLAQAALPPSSVVEMGSGAPQIHRQRAHILGELIMPFVVHTGLDLTHR